MCRNTATTVEQATQVCMLNDRDRSRWDLLRPDLKIKEIMNGRSREMYAKENIRNGDESRVGVVARSRVV